MLLNDGTMLTCGSNKYGQLGVTNFKDSLSFEKQAQNNEDPIDIAETSSEDSDESGKNGEGQSESSNDADDNEGIKPNEGASPEEHLISAPLRKKLEELKRLKDVEVPQHLKIVHGKQGLRIY